MSPTDRDVLNFLQNRIQHLTDLVSQPNVPQNIKNDLRNKIQVFREEYNRLNAECEHEFVATEMDKDGDWIEAECSKCCLRKTNS
jgi:hypothetical protein